MWQKGGGVSSSGKLFNEEKFGHVFRGGGQRDSSKVVFVKKKFVLRLPEELLSTFYLLQNIKKSSCPPPTPSLPVLITPLNSLEASHEFVNWFSTYKLFLSKCPNYGRGRGGSDPILSVQTFCVHTSLGGGRGQGILPHVQNFVVFFLKAPLRH